MIFNQNNISKILLSENDFVAKTAFCLWTKFCLGFENEQK